jgi:hypothetical protein
MQKEKEWSEWVLNSHVVSSWLQLSIGGSRELPREALLRSWVQIPPGPPLSVLEIRHWFEFILDNCRTNLAEISYPSFVWLLELLRKVYDTAYIIS